MALEICFQVSTMAAATSRACVLNGHHSFSSKEKGLKLSAHSRLSSSSPPPYFSSSSSLSHSVNQKWLRSRIVCKAREAVDEVLVVTESTWENEVIASEKPVLVDFWAPWCGPCRMIAPVIEDLAKTYAGKLVCYKVNTDDCPNIATRYGIRSIPTVLFFKNGEKKESVIGAVPLSTLTTAIEKYI